MRTGLLSCMSSSLYVISLSKRIYNRNHTKLWYRKIRNGVQTVFREGNHGNNSSGLGMGFDTCFGRFQLKRVGILGSPELLVALHGADEPRLSAWRVRADWKENISVAFGKGSVRGKTYSSSILCYHSRVEVDVRLRWHREPMLSY